MPRHYAKPDCLGSFVREEIHKKRYLQADVSRATGIREYDLSQMIVGRRMGSPVQWQKVIDFLSIPEDKFAELHKERLDRNRKGDPHLVETLLDHTRVPASALHKLADLAATMPGGCIDFKSIKVILQAWQANLYR